MSKLPQQFTSSCLELFDRVPILDPIQSSHVQEVYPKTSLTESSLEFEYQTDRNVFLDMRETYLSLRIKLLKTVIKKDNDVEETVTLTPVNNILHSLFSNVELYFNGEQVYNSNGLYAHKALISTEFLASRPENSGILSCQGYEYEENPGNLDDFADRKTNALDGISLYGRLSIDAFSCDKFLLPNTRVRIKLIRSRPNFYLCGADYGGQIQILHAVLNTRTVTVQDSMVKHIDQSLLREPAKYHFMETEARTFIIPANQNQFIEENVFNNAPIRRLALAMNTNSAFTGSYGENPFHYQRFNLGEIKIIRNNQTVVQMKTNEMAQAYVTTMKAMKFNDETPCIPFEDFQDHFILVFDLTSLQDAGDQIYYPETIGSSLRLELYFNHAPSKPVEVILLGERLSTIYIDRTGSVVKNA